MKDQHLNFGVIVLLLFGLFTQTCTQKQKTENSAQKQQTYTCPMHPQVVKHEMGTCPICAMDLVAFEKNSDSKVLKLDKTQQALANINTQVIGQNSLSGFKQLNARIVVDPRQTSFISSRITGRVEQLFVRETGVRVKKGQPLYTIYAEELATLQQEYLMAVAQQQQFEDSPIEKKIVAASKQKLLLYGQSESQIQHLQQTQKKNPVVVFYAPQNGIVAEVQVTPGQYVDTGSPIVRLEGYGQLWVEGDVYPYEIKNVQPGQQVKVLVSGFEDQPLQMRIDFVTPALQQGTQVTQIRGSIANTNNQWQPGMQVTVLLPADKPGMVLTVPVNAVIRAEKGMHVWVKKNANSFEPRRVTTGKENEAEVEITTGLQAGDEVVITGAYLLYSEYVFKKGKNPLGGLK